MESILSPEQIEEYKKAGKYMYDIDYEKIATQGSHSVQDPNVLVRYALEGIKSGLSPLELSDTERQAMLAIYGEKWLTAIGFPELEPPAGEKKKSRQQRRAEEREMKKRTNK